MNAIKTRKGDPEFRYFHIKDKFVINLFIRYKKLTESKHHGTCRVFWQTRNGKLHGQPQGVGWFSTKLYKEMARKLGRATWSECSGHSMRRSAATEYANSGMCFLSISISVSFANGELFANCAY